MTERAKLKKILEEVYQRSPDDNHFLEEIKPMKLKIKKGKIYSGISESEFTKIVDEILVNGKRKSMVVESVLDPINKFRCRDLFDLNDKMLEKPRKQILKIVEDFKAAVPFKFEIKDIFLIGSTTGFQYTETSDIDIDLITNIPNKKLREIYNLIPKDINLEGTNRPINVFIIKAEDNFNEDNAENIYDIQADVFIKKSEKNSIKVPYSHIAQLAQFFIAGCNEALSRFKVNKQEYLEYEKLDPETQEISENEKIEALDRKLSDLRVDYDRLRLAHHVIFAFEKEAYDGWPFRVSVELESNDPRYSINNTIYKYIDKFGILKELDEAAKEAKELIDSAIKEI